MTKMQISKLMLVILIIIIISTSSKQNWSYNLGGQDWPEQCHSKFQSPINISPPFTYKRPMLELSYQKMQTEYLFYNTGNNLILEGDFGYLTYENTPYFSSQITFFSPSAHTINYHRYPLEMQITHHNSNSEQITLCILFKESENDYSSLLGKIGFDDDDLVKMIPYEVSHIQEQIDIGKYVNSDGDFFFYEGTEVTPPCGKKNLMIISTNVINAGKNQLKNFPFVIKGNNRILQYRGKREIFTTFKTKDIQEKVEVNHLVVKENIMRKAESDIIDLKKKMNQLNIDAKINLNVNVSNTNKTDNKTIDEIADEINNKVEALQNITHENDDENQTNTQSCKKKVPIEVIIDRADEKGKEKKSDMKLIEGDKESHLDKELPQSYDEMKRKELEEKYEKWKILKEKIDNNKAQKVNPGVYTQFIQLGQELKNSSFYSAEYSFWDRKFSLDLKGKETYIDVIFSGGQKPNNVSKPPSPDKNNKNSFISLAESAFSELINKYLENDDSNSTNTTYYPFLNERKTIKVTPYTMNKIVSFLSEISQISVPNKEKKNGIIKLADYLIRKQNNYFVHKGILPGVFESKNKMIKRISKEKENYPYIKGKEKISSFIDKLLLYFSLIDLSNNSAYQKDKDIDYVAYEYQRSKALKKEVPLENKKNLKEIPSEDLCIEEEFSSPINILPPFLPEEKFLKFNFINPKNVELSGNAYKLNLKGEFGSFSHKGKNYIIDSVDFYSVSQHRLNSVQYPLEIQIKGRDEKTNKIGMISVLFEFSEKSNEFLSSAGLSKDSDLYLKRLREDKEKIKIGSQSQLKKLNLNNILSKREHFYTYEGTTITKPCERVKWYVMSKRSFLSRTQLEYFKSYVGTQRGSRGAGSRNRIIKSI